MRSDEIRSDLIRPDQSRSDQIRSDKPIYQHECIAMENVIATKNSWWVPILRSVTSRLSLRLFQATTTSNHKQKYMTKAWNTLCARNFRRRVLFLYQRFFSLLSSLPSVFPSFFPFAINSLEGAWRDPSDWHVFITLQANECNRLFLTVSLCCLSLSACFSKTPVFCFSFRDKFRSNFHQQTAEVYVL